MGLSSANKEMAELHDPSEVRKMSVTGEHPGIRERQWGLNARMDHTVSFEEYLYWAKIEREMEIEENRHHVAALKEGGVTGRFKEYFSMKKIPKMAGTPTTIESEKGHTIEKVKQHSGSESEDQTVTPIAPTHDFDAEWRTAARALRTSGWMTIFYLITTDILGWSQTPYVFASAGYGLGVGIFVLFGIAAAASGLMIWKTFLALDSSRYPVLSFGDPFFRVFGVWAGHTINIGQALQMFCSVAVVLTGNSQIFSQLVNGKVCYIAVIIINLVIGMASGWLRTFKQLGWICNFAVWINIVTFIIVCVAAAQHGPDPTVALETTLLKTFTPVRTFIDTPPAEYQQQTTNLFAAQFNGIDTIVYAYSGAVLFIAFLSEMRHPMDFWKGCLMAQTFIMVVYVFFGAFVYTYLGQYSITSITQVISPASLQITSNILALLTGFLAIFLYFHVGMKVVYLEVCQQVFHLPPISTKRGYYFWCALGPIYWILALIVSASIPNFTGITNFIGGLLSLNFTYSIPAIMFVGYKIQEAAILPGEGFEPSTGVTTRHDNGMTRWVRGFKKSWALTLPAILFAMGGLASSGMGCWSAIEGLIQIFGPGGTIQTSWGCAGPS